MRYDVKKFLFIGIAEEKTNFFKKAQEIGTVNFIEMSGKGKEIPDDISNLVSAIKVLRGLPIMEQESLENFTQADDLVQKILHYRHQIEKLEEEKRLVRLEIARIGIFGDFSKEDIAYIEREGNCKIQFYFAKHGIAEEDPLPAEVFFVDTDHNLDYFVAINPASKQFDKLVEMRIEHPLGELKSRHHQIEKQIHQNELSLKNYAKYNKFLHQALTYKLNQYNLAAAQSNVQTKMDDHLFLVQGWVPVNKMKELHQLVNDLNVHTEEIAPDPMDIVPTYLENQGVPRIGEDIVHVYDTPSTTDKDPSIWVLVFFSFFFAFIVGDAGYGLIFLSIALYLRFKYGPLSGGKKRFLQLFTILSISCIGWGLLTHSFFGISFGPESPMRKVSLLNWLIEKKAAYHIEQKDETYQYWVKQFPQLEGVTDSHEFVSKGVNIVNGSPSYEIINQFTSGIMMELALIVGIVHIVFSMLRYANRNWALLGWIAFIIGGYLYFPHFLKTPSILDFVLDINREKLAMDGLYLIFGGITFATVVAIIKNKFLGLLEPLFGIQVFGDIMSYLRLYALGLAGAMVTGTINEAAAGVGIVVAILLVVIGNAINIVLSIQGGVIHGLRLNFLEWYHYSFEGGGKMFKPLRKIPIE